MDTPGVLVYRILEIGLPLVAGTCLTLVGYGVVKKEKGADPKWDAWVERYGGQFKWLGPALIVFTIVFLVIRLGEP